MQFLFASDSCKGAEANSHALYLDAARRLLRALRCGMQLAQKA